jgi:hypothetical protein
MMSTRGRRVGCGSVLGMDRQRCDGRRVGVWLSARIGPAAVRWEAGGTVVATKRLSEWSGRWAKWSTCRRWVGADYTTYERWNKEAELVT